MGFNQSMPLPMTFTKQYNINLDKPGYYRSGMVDVLRTDILPFRNRPTFTQLGTRTELADHINTNISPGMDGTYGGFEAQANKSYENYINLSSKIKFVDAFEVNYPDFSSIRSKHLVNPFLRIFRSCYPIAADRDGKAQCSSNSIAIHVRAHHLTTSEMTIFRSLTPHVYYCHPFQEIVFYRTVREQILKNKVSPNFVCMYKWYRNPKGEQVPIGSEFRERQLHRLKEAINSKEAVDKFMAHSDII